MGELSLDTQVVRFRFLPPMTMFCKSAFICDIKKILCRYNYYRIIVWYKKILLKYIYQLNRGIFANYTCFVDILSPNSRMKATTF